VVTIVNTVLIFHFYKYSWLSLSRIRWDHGQNSSQPYFDSRGATKIPEVWFV
jgi:hypothetical protein